MLEGKCAPLFAYKAAHCYATSVFFFIQLLIACAPTEFKPVHLESCLDQTNILPMSDRSRELTRGHTVD